jgi:hypothetical protein
MATTWNSVTCLPNTCGQKDFSQKQYTKPETGIKRALSGETCAGPARCNVAEYQRLRRVGRIRTISGIPVLMPIVRGDDIDRINGLEIGTDDCLPKVLVVTGEVTTFPPPGERPF